MAENPSQSRRIRRFSMSIAMALLTAACASGNFVSPTASTTAPRPSGSGNTGSNGGFVAPQVMRGSGVESVIGERAGALISRFGQARIDLVEGDVRKLQFASESCVLDVFLYPLQSGAPPIATHIEARIRQGGGDASRAACIADVESAARRR